MKRRFFIQTTTFSSISLGVVSTDLFYFPLTFESSSFAKWLRQINWTLSVKRRAKASIAPDSFAQISGEKNEYFTERGYQKMTDNCYFFGDQEEGCFYPMVFRHTTSGTTDLILPVFHRDADHNWQFVQTLSGYQVEAMVKASSALQKHSPSAIQNLLFPIEKDTVNYKAGSYRTQEGMVSVITNLKNGKAQTTCTVTGRAGKVFHETYTSRYCLNA